MPCRPAVCLPVQVRLWPVSMAPLGVASAVQKLPQLKALLRLSLGDGGTEGVSAGRPSASDKWRVWEPDDSCLWEESAGPVAALLNGLRAVNAERGQAAGRPAAAQPLGGLVTVYVFGKPATELAQFRSLGEELAHWDGVRVRVYPYSEDRNLQQPYAEAVGALLRGTAGVVTELHLEAFDDPRGDPVLAALLRWGR